MVLARAKGLEGLALGLSKDQKILVAAQRVLDGKLDLDHLVKPEVSCASAMYQLMGCHGVGPKIAACIALFPLGKTDAFPVDVRVRNATSKCLWSQAPLPEKEAAAWGARFGEQAGYVNQFLFRLTCPPALYHVSREGSERQQLGQACCRARLDRGWGGGPGAERALGPLCVVFPAPACDPPLRFRERGEDLPVKARVTQFAVAGLDIAVLPGAARLDEAGGAADAGPPGSDRRGGARRAGIGAQRGRRPARAEALGAAGQHVVRPASGARPRSRGSRVWSHRRRSAAAGGARRGSDPARRRRTRRDSGGWPGAAWWCRPPTTTAAGAAASRAHAAPRGATAARPGCGARATLRPAAAP